MFQWVPMFTRLAIKQIAYLEGNGVTVQCYVYLNATGVAMWQWKPFFTWNKLSGR